MPEKIADKAARILIAFSKARFKGSIRQASQYFGLDSEGSALGRWIKDRAPSLRKIGPCLDKIGAVLLSPEEAAAFRESQETIAALEKRLVAMHQLEGELRVYRQIMESLIARGVLPRPDETDTSHLPPRVAETAEEDEPSGTAGPGFSPY